MLDVGSTDPRFPRPRNLKARTVCKRAHVGVVRGEQHADIGRSARENQRIGSDTDTPTEDRGSWQEAEMFRLENEIIGDLRLERSGNLSAARVNGAAMLHRLSEIRLPLANVGIRICAASRSRVAIFLAKGRACTKEIRRRWTNVVTGNGEGSIDAGGKPYKITPAPHGEGHLRRPGF